MLHFLLLVLLSNFLMVAGPASATSLTYDRSYWLKLLHYQKGESRTDGEHFFLASNGKTNPDAELAATIVAFKEPLGEAGWFKYHPQCVFRERFNFLKKSGLLDDVKTIPCQQFDEWKNGLNAESLTLIFSSSYPNNPSSLFGHTLLRFNQKGKTNDLLDYSVAFSAIPEKEDLGVVFAFKGLFGGYKGLFEVTKYYTKVNEYNNGESRDLIEYDLHMTPDELDRMINHLWELYQTTYFDYYFADENCSAVLADVLAVPFHNEKDVNKHDRWYYLPSEMVKHFRNLPGRITNVKYRPSLKKQLTKKWDGLGPVEIREVKKILDKKEIPAGYSNTKVLDTVIGYLDFTHYRLKEKLPENQQKLMRSTLIKRAALPKAEVEQIYYDESNRPDEGHEPQKFSVFSKFEDKRFQMGLELKQGYHDLMSNDRGFDPFSQFDFLTGSVLYDFDLKEFNYEQITFVDLISLHEYRYFDPQLSWRAKLSADRIYELDCDLCHKFNANAYAGPSFKINERGVLTPLLGVFGEVSDHFEKGYKLGIAAEISFYQQLGNSYKIGLIDELRLDATEKIREDYVNTFTLRQSVFLGTKGDVRLDSKFLKNTTVHQVTYGFYF